MTPVSRVVELPVQLRCVVQGGGVGDDGAGRVDQAAGLGDDRVPAGLLDRVGGTEVDRSGAEFAGLVQPGSCTMRETSNFESFATHVRQDPGR